MKVDKCHKLPLFNVVRQYQLQVLNFNANLDVGYDIGILEVLDLLASWDPHASANSYLHANMDLGARARVQYLDPLAKTATMGGSCLPFPWSLFWSFPFAVPPPPSFLPLPSPFPSF